jgi:hypothetical protein
MLQQTLLGLAKAAKSRRRLVIRPSHPHIDTIAGYAFVGAGG